MLFPLPALSHTSHVFTFHRPGRYSLRYTGREPDVKGQIPQAGGLARAMRGRAGVARWRAMGLIGGLFLSTLPCAVGAASLTAPASAGSWRDVTPFRQLANTESFLESRGVTFGGFVQADGSHVLAGGLPDALGLDAQYLLDLDVTLDTGKLLGWPGGTLFIDAQSHGGPNVITHQVPALADPDNMDAYRTNSVDRAWYQQNFLGQKVQLQLGLMYVDDKFYTVPYGQNFVSLDFSSDASISTFVLPTYPKGSWGGNLWLYPDPHVYFSLGVFRDHETELPYDPGGKLIVSEEGWQNRWHGLPYEVQVGAWVDTGTFQRFQGGLKHHASGVYLVVSDKLWQPAGAPDRGLGMFLQLGTGPPIVAAVRRHYGIGLVWTGPVAARPKDEIGMAFSDSVLTGEDGFAHGYESEIEAYYQIDATHGFTVQPDLEYWQHPGGGTTPATVLGLIRFMYSF